MSDVTARQSTARTVIIGPVLDSDGVAVTDAAVGDFLISKNGAAPAALNASATLTHRNTGHYSLALTASDLDTIGQAEIVIDKTTDACPVKVVTVVEEAIYDALFAAGATGYSTHTAENVVDEWETQSQADPTGFHVNVQEWLGSIVDSIINLGEGKNYPAVYLAGAEAATGQDWITNWINNYNGTLTSFDGLDAAQDSQHATTLSKLLKYTQLIVRSDSGIFMDNATELNEINADGGSGAGDYSNQAEALEAIRDRGDLAWITATGFSTHSAADIWAVGTRVLTAGTNIVLAKDTGVTGFNDPTKAAIAAEILAAGDVDGFSLEETLKLCLAALAGKLSGAATNTVVIRAADDSKARLTATVDANGNRSSVSLDASG